MPVSYDGLCGVARPHPLFDGTLFRCQYEFGHIGKHSWAKYGDGTITGGITRDEVAQLASEGSPAAQAISDSEREAIVAKYLLTPNGKHRLRRAIGFHGTWAEVKARWAKRLWILSRMKRLGMRVIK